MSREVRRVPEAFGWPLNQTWQGYLSPDFLREKDCPDCTHGLSEAAERFHDEWYGNAPFDPRSMDSEPFDPAGEEAMGWARFQVERNPQSYGQGHDAVIREAQRIAGYWNEAWMHHLTEEDVAALIKAERLMDFNHSWNREERRWIKKDGVEAPTAREVNRWSLQGLGHDSTNAYICVKARAKREGVAYLCGTCKGHARIEAFKGQRKAAKKWKPLQPPKGDWWQLWETVSEGSPITPAFPTAMALANHIFYSPQLLGSSGHAFADLAAAKEWVEKDGWTPSLVLAKRKENS